VAGKGDPGRRGGFTVIEALIVLAILGIVVVIAVDSFRGIGEKYRVEGETKQLYADLMDARGRAMQRNRASFVVIDAAGSSYRTYEDTSPAPDGNGTLDNTADTRITTVTLQFPITASLSGGATDFAFRRNGTASATGHVRFSSTARPDYDCVGVGTTRLHMGQYNSGTGTCVEK
jgi:prepilin-type N-terminal cleavage/methylation domain-containing protein